MNSDSRYVADELERRLRALNIYLENIQFADKETLFLEVVTKSSDPEEIFMHTDMKRLLVSYGVLAEDVDWQDGIQRVVLQLYDPADPTHKREDAIRLYIEREWAKEYEEDDLVATEFFEHVLDTVQLVRKDGSVEDAEIEITWE